MKQRVHEPLAETLRGPAAILLVSCYELGHQPLGLASPLGFLERAGFTPEVLDIAVERFGRRGTGLVALATKPHLYGFRRGSLP